MKWRNCPFLSPNIPAKSPLSDEALGLASSAIPVSTIRSVLVDQVLSSHEHVLSVSSSREKKIQKVIFTLAGPVSGLMSRPVCLLPVLISSHGGTLAGVRRKCTVVFLFEDKKL
jgi:hypothetical protein